MNRSISISTVVSCRLAFTAGRCHYRLLRENKRERSRTFSGINRFLHIQMSSWRRNKAIIQRWDGCDRVLGRIEKEYGDGEPPALVTVGLPDHCHIRERERWRVSAGRHFTNYMKYIRCYPLTCVHGAQTRH